MSAACTIIDTYYCCYMW